MSASLLHFAIYTIYKTQIYIVYTIFTIIINILPKFKNVTKKTHNYYYK